MKTMKKYTRIALMLLMLTVATAMIASSVSAQDETNEADNAFTVEAYGKLGAGIALGACGIATGMSQGQIGASGVGMVAEDGSKFVTALIFMAIPETIVLFGFVAVFLL